MSFDPPAGMSIPTTAVHAHEDLAALIRAGAPLIAIDTDEEPEVIQTFRHVIAQTLRPLFSWSVTQGLKRLDFADDVPGRTCGPSEVLQVIRESTQRGIYLLLDFAPYLRYVATLRHLREISQRQGCAEHTVVLIGTKLDLPAELERLATPFRMKLPSEEALSKMVREEASAFSREQGGKRVQVHLPSLNAIARCLRGLSLSDARRIARRLIVHDGALTASDVAMGAKLKFELLGDSSVLHFEIDDAKLEDVAGLAALKRWVAQRRAVFRGEGPSGQLDPPRGVLLLGVQGCGKSLAAKAIAGGFGVPLLRLEMASLYNKFHGETERNLREALDRADQMTPCVLWIDEIEKGLAGGSADDGVSRRVLGFLLTWMAERKHPVFLVATANAIEQLPPELLRKGRFDEIFFVDLPSAEVRQQVLELHLKRRQLDPQQFALARLAELAEGFSGAELEQAVVSALYAAHADQVPLSNSHLLAELRRTRPLSVVMAEKVDALREWARGRTVLAD